MQQARLCVDKGRGTRAAAQRGPEQSPRDGASRGRNRWESSRGEPNLVQHAPLSREVSRDGQLDDDRLVMPRHFHIELEVVKVDCPVALLVEEGACLCGNLRVRRQEVRSQPCGRALRCTPAARAGYKRGAERVIRHGCS